MIADHHTLFRDALVASLQSRPDYEVVGEARNGFEAIDAAQALHPDVVLTELALPGLDGPAVIRRIAQQMPDVKVVVVTASNDDMDILEAVQAGASGYIFKTASVDSLIEQLDHVATGGVAMTDDVTQRLMHATQERTSAPDEQQLRHAFNPRDLEILDLVAQGLTNREIADTLTMSEHTVRAHVRSLMHKLNVENRTQLAVYSTRAGMGSGRSQRAADGVRV